MTIFLGAFLLVPLMGLGFLFSAVTLYFTLKFFAVPENGFGRALTVTVMALLGSLGVGLLMGLLSLVLPIIAGPLGVVAPFGIYLLLLQRYYGLSLLQGTIASVIQGLITVLLGVAVVVGVLLPMGLASILD